MNRINLWLLILLGFQVVLFSVVFSFCGQAESGRSERVLVLKDIPRDQISRITVENAEGKTLLLVRTENEWKLPSKSNYPAEPEKVDRLFGKLFGLESSYVISTGSEHHRKLEVAEDKFKRKVTLEAGNEKHVFLLGSLNTDNFVSVRMQTQPKIYAVDGIREWDLGVQISDWAKNPYFEVETNQVSGIQLDHGTQKMVLTRDHLDEWKLDGKPVDKEKVNKWLEAVSNIQLSDVEGEVADLKQATEAMKKKKQQIVVTLLVSEEPLKVSGSNEASETKERQIEPPGVQESMSDKAGQPEQEAPKQEPMRKIIRIAAGSKDDQKVLVYVEGESYLIVADRWRMREIFEAGPKKLAQKSP